MSLAILFRFLCTQHVSDINIPIIRSLRLCCWITSSVVLFSVRCVLEIWCGWVWVVSVLQACLQHGHYSNQTMMHGPINIRSPCNVSGQFLVQHFLLWPWANWDNIVKDERVVKFGSIRVWLPTQSRIMIPDHGQFLIQGVCLASDGVEVKAASWHACAGREGRRKYSSIRKLRARRGWVVITTPRPIYPRERRSDGHRTQNTSFLPAPPSIYLVKIP